VPRLMPGQGTIVATGAISVPPGLKSIDPYDLIAVLAGPGTLAYSDKERTAHRVRKVPYEVGLEVPPYRVIGALGLSIAMSATCRTCLEVKKRSMVGS